MVLAFELLAVPYLTPWLGVQTSQRLGSVFEVPAYVLFPLLSLVNNTGYPVTVPVLILLFTSYVCTNSVGGCCTCGSCGRAETPKRELIGMSGCH